jgi:nitrate reductase gamma subunit
MNEKIYKTMGLAGIGAMVLGIITIVVGVVTGVLGIVGGCFLLKRRKNITF